MDGTTAEERTLPPGYRLRPPSEDDAASIARVNAASDASVGAHPALNEPLLRYLWSRPRFALDRDAWVVEHEGEPIGYAQVWGEAPTRLTALGVVHPRHTGRGIGSLLARLVEGRGAEMASENATLLTAITSENAAAASLLSGRGYAFARRFWHMEIELDGDPVPAARPRGVELRDLDLERDLRAAHRILEQAFEDHWDFTPTTFEKFLDLEVRQDGFDPGLWVISVEGDEPVGVLSASLDPDRGWIDQVGVLRSHRGRGIASALLRESFLRFRRRGAPRVRLTVDSDSQTGAVSVYEKVGMRAVSSYDWWARAIEPSRNSPHHEA